MGRGNLHPDVDIASNVTITCEDVTVLALLQR
jgi:hypothetical protein